jgi:hypothetical protein
MKYLALALNEEEIENLTNTKAKAAIVLWESILNLFQQLKLSRPNWL